MSCGGGRGGRADDGARGEGGEDQVVMAEVGVVSNVGVETKALLGG